MVRGPAWWRMLTHADARAEAPLAVPTPAHLPLLLLGCLDALPAARCAACAATLHRQVGAVLYTFADWHKTRWDVINVDSLVEETKKMAKEVKTLNKAVSCAALCGVAPRVPGKALLLLSRAAQQRSRHALLPALGAAAAPRCIRTALARCATTRCTACWRRRSRRCSPACRWCRCGGATHTHACSLAACLCIHRPPARTHPRCRSATTTAITRPGPAQPGDARAPLAHADGLHRQVVCHGRQVLPRPPAGPGAAQLRGRVQVRPARRGARTRCAASHCMRSRSGNAARPCSSNTAATLLLLPCPYAHAHITA